MDKIDQALPPEPGKPEEEAKNWGPTRYMRRANRGTSMTQAYRADVELSKEVEWDVYICIDEYAHTVQRLVDERDSLRAALEQVKAERDELLKGEKSELWLKDLADRDAALARIASLEEGLRRIVIRSKEASPHLAHPQSVWWETHIVPIARALLAAGEKAGGENV